MKKIKSKKLLNLTTGALFIAPILSVVSCGKEEAEKNKENKNLKDLITKEQLNEFLTEEKWNNLIKDIEKSETFSSKFVIDDSMNLKDQKINDISGISITFSIVEFDNIAGTLTLKATASKDKTNGTIESSNKIISGFKEFGFEYITQEDLNNFLTEEKWNNLIKDIEKSETLPSKLSDEQLTDLSNQEIEGITGISIAFSIVESDNENGTLTLKATASKEGENRTIESSNKIISGFKTFGLQDITQQQLNNFLTEEKWNKSIQGITKSEISPSKMTNEQLTDLSNQEIEGITGISIAFSIVESDNENGTLTLKATASKGGRKLESSNKIITGFKQSLFSDITQEDLNNFLTEEKWNNSIRGITKSETLPSKITNEQLTNLSNQEIEGVSGISINFSIVEFDDKAGTLTLKATASKDGVNGTLESSNKIISEFKPFGFEDITQEDLNNFLTEEKWNNSMQGITKSETLPSKVTNEQLTNLKNQTIEGISGISINFSIVEFDDKAATLTLKATASKDGGNGTLESSNKIISEFKPFGFEDITIKTLSTFLTSNDILVNKDLLQNELPSEIKSSDFKDFESITIDGIDGISIEFIIEAANNVTGELNLIVTFKKDEMLKEVKTIRNFMTFKDLKNKLGLKIENSTLMNYLTINEKESSFEFENLTTELNFGESLREEETLKILKYTSKIGKNAFYSSNNIEISTLNLPLCTSIGEGAFELNGSLSTLNLPNLKTIGNKAFYHNTFIKVLDLPLCTSIGDSAFHSNKWISTLNLRECISIGDSAFYFNDCIETLNLENLQTIGNNAFYTNYLLTTLNLPNLQTIGDNAFRGNNCLRTLNLQECTSIGNNAFYTNIGIKTLELPNCISIGNNAFESNEELSSLNLPNLQTIGDNAFYFNTTISTLTLENCTSIGNNAFYSNISLRTLNLPNLQTIGDYAFYSNYSISSLTLENCTSIGESAFDSNTSLTSLNLPNCISIGNNAFHSNETIEALDLPLCTSIGDSAFHSNGALITLNLENLQTIGDSAFYFNTTISSLTLQNCTSIAKSAFDSNTSLTTLNLPNLQTIGDYAFYSNTIITSIKLPECTSIGIAAFNGNTSLTTLELPKCISIWESAFKSIPENQITTWDLTALKLAYTNDQNAIGVENAEIVRIIELGATSN